MDTRSGAQIIETFHLLFLQALTANSQNWFVLKGGTNLRYFFQSDRYSNDIDLDFFDRPGWNVETSVDKVLQGPALGVLLRQQNLMIAEVSKPKQTETTRRWKIALTRRDAEGERIRTKIEFSGRGEPDGEWKFEVIPSEVVDPYGIRAISINRYGLSAALRQKIAALAQRSETKARDVFDIDLLLRLNKSAAIPELDRDLAQAAAVRAEEITFESFNSEVLPFLDEDVAVLYQTEAVWLSMRSNVSSALSNLANLPDADYS